MTTLSQIESWAMVSEKDYALARQLLLEDPYSSVYDRESHVLLLTLCFRFGLRIGEAMRLSTADVVPGEPIVLLIRANRWGRPKTDAGFRQVPDLFMTAEESNLLERRVAQVSQVAGLENWPLLFGQQDDPMLRDDRFGLANSVIQALKLATGSRRTRTHHCRHTYASRVMLLALGNDFPWTDSSPTSARNAVYSTLLGPTHTSRRISMRFRKRWVIQVRRPPFRTICMDLNSPRQH